ncbi:MAG: YkgJ family cysteine cluster protein [Planctomycetota bacterium]|nr:YkgJ family cysteine cluster protein [Planctomycetota bacterium]
MPITGADVLRIEREEGRAFDEFACRWADPEGRVARRMAPHFFFDDEPHTPFVICLRHDASETHPGTTKCGFLVEREVTQEQPLGTARCGIHANRPLACRSFPMKFNTTGELTVLYDVPQRGRKDEHPAYTLCPRPWRADEVDPLQAPQDLAVAKFEMEFFRSVALAWNRTPRAFGEFLEFLRLIYLNRVLASENRSTAAVSRVGISRAA